MVVQVVVPLVHKAGLVLCETTGHRWWLVLGCAVLCCNLDMGHHHTEPGHHWHSDRRYGSWVVGQHTALYHCNLFSLSTCHHMSRAQHSFPAESLETAVAGDTKIWVSVVSGGAVSTQCAGAVT